MCDDESAFTYSHLLLVMGINFSVLFWCSYYEGCRAVGLMVLLSLSKKPFVLCVGHSVEMAEEH
jgi:hypothetical protein